VVFRKITDKPSLIYLLELVTLTIAAILSAIFGTWLGDRTAPSTVERIEVVTPTVHPGDDASYIEWLYRQKACATRADRVWIDSKGTRFSADTVNYTLGSLPTGHDHTVLHVAVPLGVAPGPLKLVTTVVYLCNPLQRAFWPIVAEPRVVDFNVVGK
jgi:hypothetical protein